MRRGLGCLDLAGLLVDVAVALALLAFLEQAGGSHDEHDVDADHAEDSRENVVDKDVRERADRCSAPAHERSSGGAWARRVRHKGGRCAVEVATAAKLSTSQRRPEHTPAPFLSATSSLLPGKGKLTAVCMRSWICEVWAFQTGPKSSLVLSVKIHKNRPRTKLKVPHNVTSRELNLSHERVGVMMPGILRRKVTKIKTELAIPATRTCQPKLAFSTQLLLCFNPSLPVRGKL